MHTNVSLLYKVMLNPNMDYKISYPNNIMRIDTNKATYAFDICNEIQLVGFGFD